MSLSSAPDLMVRTAPLYDRVKSVIPSIEWPAFAGDIDAILKLKREHDAVILAHNYQTPEIFHCVADIVGDSLALAREAMKVDARVIVLAGVHFMAETAKLLNPAKRVLIPDLGAGCSLAESITAADVRLLRQRYHFAGELRAVGDILHDQLYYLQRVGFDSYLLKDGKDAVYAVASAFSTFSEHYQASTTQPEPAFRRRA